MLSMLNSHCPLKKKPSSQDSSPANVPGIVNDLLQLPTGKIIKIAAGGHLIMALTEGNDLYIWGGHPGLPAALTGLTMYPTPFTGDVMDFATGANHAVILTLEGDLFGTGDNRNGQLGLTTISRLSSWTKLSRAWGPGKSIFAVACGPRSTFLKIR